MPHTHFTPPTHVCSASTVQFHTMHHQHVTVGWLLDNTLPAAPDWRSNVPQTSSTCFIVKTTQWRMGANMYIYLCLAVNTGYKHELQVIHTTVRPYAHLVCSSGFQTDVCYEGWGDGGFWRQLPEYLLPQIHSALKQTPHGIAPSHWWGANT